jgi:hypothetical protein
VRRLFAGTVLVGLVVLFGAPGAFAQTQYPPHAPTGAVEPAAGACGSTVTVTGSNWKANSTVTLTFNSQSVALGSVTTDGTGAFNKTIQVPSPIALGAHTVGFSGFDQANGPQNVSSTFSVTTCGAVASAGLAFTGSNYTSLYVGGAIALILVGLMLSIAAARHRRTRFEV